MENKDSELMTIAKENGLEQPQVEGLLAKFGDNFTATKATLAKARDIKVTSENQKSDMDKARLARLELKRIRIEVEHTRKGLKEQSLREGKAIDGMANIIKAMIVPAEEYLEKQEKFAENLAAERKSRLIAERMNVLLKYTDVPNMYSFETMDDATFEALVSELKAAKDIKDAAEKKAEADRIAKEKAEVAERERIRVENAKLKAEAEVREAAIAKERAEAEAKLKAEREAREAAEKLEADRKEAERQKLAEEADNKRKSLLAPDKDKLLAFADVIDNLELPKLSSREAGKVLDEAEDYLSRISKNLRAKAEQL